LTLFFVLHIPHSFYILKMKFNALSLGLVAGLAMAAPTPTINEDANFAQVAKRASITDAATGK
jgi:hypothetical protein